MSTPERTEAYRRWTGSEPGEARRNEGVVADQSQDRCSSSQT